VIGVDDADRKLVKARSLTVTSIDAYLLIYASRPYLVYVLINDTTQESRFGAIAFLPSFPMESLCLHGGPRKAVLVTARF
jgi:hypothetical protein